MALIRLRRHQTDYPVWKYVLLYKPSMFLRRLYFATYRRLYKFINTLFITEIICSVYYSILEFVFQDKKHLQWKTHWQSPKCDDILKRKFYMSRSKSAFAWGVFYLLFLLLLIIEMKSNSIERLLGVPSDIAWYVGLSAAVVLGFNIVTAFSLYIYSVFSKPLTISPAQQKLFRIGDNDAGFKVEPQRLFTNSPKQEHFKFSCHESFDSGMSFLSTTPLDYSAASWASDSPNLDTTSSSWSFHRLSPAEKYMLTSTPKHNESFMARRISDHSPFSPFERKIKNAKELDDFLREQEEESKRMKAFVNDPSKSLLSNITTIDTSPLSVLRKCRYQRATRLPRSEATEGDSSDVQCSENIWYKLKVTDKMLTMWSERLRKWLCQTILMKLVSEIEDINNMLSQMGLPEFHIGSVNLFALHQIAITKSQQLPTLATVLPYLDMHLNQEYLVHRLKDLARGGCMGDFKWNSGGSYNDKQWCDDLPTDAAIIMHVLCCYMDAHLPPEPHCPEGKPFSSKYFKKIPEKPVPAKDLHYIYQSSINPPHFKVAIDKDTYSLPKGRNNLFFSILVFLRYLKTKECGMLGRVSLGPSGLNILWVID